MSRLADRVKETTTTTGLGSVALGGAVPGFRGFLAALGPGPVYYAIVAQTAGQWEDGIGTLTASPDTLARATVLSSSAGGAKVDFVAGVKDVFCTAPAAALAPSGVPRVSGLLGVNNVTTPTTKYDLTSARYIELRSPTDGSKVVVEAAGLVTIDTGLAGPAAGGRDQSAAFSANSWLHTHYMWNGTLAGTFSLSPTAPVLPSGYTHRAYAGALRFNASSQLVRTRFAGAQALYPASQLVLPSGGATTPTPVDLSPYIPPNALRALLAVTADVSDSATQAGTAVVIRVEAGLDFFMVRVVTNTINSQYTAGGSTVIPNLGQTCTYHWTSTLGNTTRTATISCPGYVMPNGGE